MIRLFITLLCIVGINIAQDNTSAIQANNVHLLTELTLAYESDYDLYSPTDLVFIPNSSILAFVNGSSIVDNGPLLFYDIEKSEVVELLDKTYQAVRVITSSDGKLLYIGNREGDISVFDTVTGELTNTFSANNEVIEAIDVSDDGKYIATASTNSMIGYGTYAFSLFTTFGEPIFQKDLSDGDGLATTFIDKLGLLVYVTEASQMGTVRLLDIITGEQLSTCDGHDFRSRDIISSADGKHIFYISDKGVRKWDLRDCELYPDAWSLITQTPENEFIHAVAINPTETILAIAGEKYLNPGYTGVIRLIDLETSELLKTIEIPFTDISNDYPMIDTLAFSPDGTLLASGGADGTVRLWGIPAGE